MHAIDLAVVGVYVAMMLGVGVLVSSRIHGFRDYFVAGGRLTTPLLVCTLVSTYYGLDVLYISGGIHARDYGEPHRPDPDRLSAFLSGHGYAPVAVMPRLA